MELLLSAHVMQVNKWSCGLKDCGIQTFQHISFSRAVFSLHYFCLDIHSSSVWIGIRTDFNLFKWLGYQLDVTGPKFDVACYWKKYRSTFFFLPINGLHLNYWLKIFSGITENVATILSCSFSILCFLFFWDYTVFFIMISIFWLISDYSCALKQSHWDMSVPCRKNGTLVVDTSSAF